jgi:hypothetical protein
MREGERDEARAFSPAGAGPAVSIEQSTILRASDKSIAA